MAASQCLVGWAAALLRMSEPTLTPTLETWNHQVNVFCNSVIIDLKACTKQTYEDKVMRQYVKLYCIVYMWLLGVWQTDYLTNYCFNIFSEEKVLLILDFFLPLFVHGLKPICGITRWELLFPWYTMTSKVCWGDLRWNWVWHFFY